MKAKKLRQHPAKFLRLSGLAVAQFDHLVREVTAAYPHFNRQRLMHQERQREVGGGRAFHLTLEDRVVLLVWLRLYPTNELLGYLFALDASNISRNLRLVLPLCEAHLPTPFQPARECAGRKPEKAPQRRKKIGTIEELLRRYPDLRDVIVDATEQSIERPTDKRVQKKHYSGKKKRHTRKTQLTTLPNGMIVHLSKSVPGRVHDYKLLHRSGLDRAVPPEYGWRVDKGYKGSSKTILIARLPSRCAPANCIR